MNDKKYLVMVSEKLMPVLGALCPGLEFVAVAGMNIQNNDKHQLLVTPVIKLPLVENDVPVNENVS